MDCLEGEGFYTNEDEEYPALSKHIENTKNVLISSIFIHLKWKDYVKFASELPTISPHILLSGPAGSDICQEKLTKALAKHFEAKLLFFDSSSIPMGHTSKDAELLKEGLKCLCVKQPRGHSDNLQHKGGLAPGLEMDAAGPPSSSGLKSQGVTGLNLSMLLQPSLLSPTNKRTIIWITRKSNFSF